MTDLPYPIDKGSTHWEGCYRERRHHNCAVAEVDRLRAENERLREALERITNTQPMYGGVPSYFMRIAREAMEAPDA